MKQLIENPSPRTLYMRGWRDRNRQHNADYFKPYNREYKRRMKLSAFDRYGGAVCVCCGEQTVEFLAMDHIDGGGNEHRKETGGGGTMFYRWRRRNDVLPLAAGQRLPRRLPSPLSQLQSVKGFVRSLSSHAVEGQVA